MFFTESGHQWLWVLAWRFDGNKNVAGQNLYNMCCRLGCFFQVKWYKVRAKKKNKLIMEFVRVG